MQWLLFYCYLIKDLVEKYLVYLIMVFFKAEEWHARAAKLNEMCNAVNRLFQRLTYCNNRELLYELYSYIWDMRGVVSLLNSYIKWLGR